MWLIVKITRVFNLRKQRNRTIKTKKVIKIKKKKKATKDGEIFQYLLFKYKNIEQWKRNQGNRDG